MAALIKPKARKFGSSGDPKHIGYRVLADAVIHHGAAVVVDTTASAGWARPLSYNAAYVFAGFAEENVDATGLANGVLTAKLRTSGLLVVPQSEVAGADPEDVGDTVYMTDDNNAFTLTSTNAVPIGKLAAVDETTGEAVIHFEGAGVASV